MQDLLQASDPRAFLKSSLRFHISGGKPISISRRCGFSSRSFLVEYLKGKKKLSQESVRSIRKALKLSREYKELFQLLVMLDQPELSSAEPESLRREINRVQNLILVTARYEGAGRSSISPVMVKRDCYRVYAALGTAGGGASLSEILLRSQVSERSARLALKALLESGIVSQSEERFYPKAAVLDFFNFSSPELEALLVELTSEIRTQASSYVRDPHNLMVYSAFSIDIKNISKFRARLREAIFDVIDEFQDDTGGRVHEILVCTKS